MSAARPSDVGLTRFWERIAANARVRTIIDTIEYEMIEQGRRHHRPEADTLSLIRRIVAPPVLPIEDTQPPDEQ